MMGRLSHDQEQFFYSFRLDEAVPEDHAVREIAAVLDLSWAHSELAPYYPEIGRPSIDPVLMIRMLIVGYVFGIRSERALCREVQVNLAYRWFCGLSIEDKVPDHSAFSRARNERFGDSNVFRCVFERIVGTCIAAGLVGGEGFAVDASLIQADAPPTAAAAFGGKADFHSTKWSWLKAWAMKIARHRGMKKAIVASARRLAVIMHRIWVDGTEFRWTREVAAA